MQFSIINYQFWYLVLPVDIIHANNCFDFRVYISSYIISSASRSSIKCATLLRVISFLQTLLNKSLLKKCVQMKGAIICFHGRKVKDVVFHGCGHFECAEYQQVASRRLSTKILLKNSLIICGECLPWVILLKKNFITTMWIWSIVSRLK